MRLGLLRAGFSLVALRDHGRVLLDERLDGERDGGVLIDAMHNAINLFVPSPPKVLLACLVNPTLIGDKLVLAFFGLVTRFFQFNY